MHEDEEVHGEKKAGTLTASGVQIGGWRCKEILPPKYGLSFFYLFLSHGSFIHTKSASAGNSVGSCRVQENDTSTFCTA